MNCPYCNSSKIYAEFVDVGIGFEQVTPYQCESCGAMQFNAYTENHPELLSDTERKYGWYKPRVDGEPCAKLEFDITVCSSK